jgi:LysM repeat protein
MKKTNLIVLLLVLSNVAFGQIITNKDDVTYVKYDATCMRKVFYRKEGIVEGDDHNSFVLNINDTMMVGFIIYNDIGKRKTLKTEMPGNISCENRNINLTTINEINLGTKVGVFLEETPAGVLLAPISEVTIMTKSENYFTFKSTRYDIVFDLKNHKAIKSLADGKNFPLLTEIEVECKQAFIFQDYDALTNPSGSTLRYIPDVGPYNIAYHEGSYNCLLVNYGSIAKYMAKLCAKNESFFKKVENPGIVKSDKSKKKKTAAPFENPVNQSLAHVENRSIGVFEALEEKEKEQNIQQHREQPKKEIQEKVRASNYSDLDRSLTIKGQEKAISQVITHKVQQGETVFSISRKHNITPTELILLNKLPNTQIQVGQELSIKAPKTSETPRPSFSNPSAKVVSLVKETKTTHLVQTGETLYSVSRKYNIPVQQIIDSNGIKNNVIMVGQTLIIREGSLADL